MIALLVQKELKNILTSPKLLSLFITASILILMSIYVGIKEYEESLAQFRASEEIAYQNMLESRNYTSMSDMVHRKPKALHSLISGVHYDIGRLSSINPWGESTLSYSPYSENPVFALFRIMDLSMIMQLVLTLFALVFTYDAVNGERERGTLKLVMANGISRIQWMLGKWIGISIGFIVPLFLPITLGLLMIQLSSMPLSSEEWVRLVLFIG